MRYLLDTHTFLWWMDDPSLLSDQAKSAIKNGRNTVYVSAAGIWEIVIKRALGKLEIPHNIEEALKANRFFELPITMAHALVVETLPGHHRDPFDRMLIAQSISEGLTLVTRDPDILKYSVTYLVA